MTLLDALTLIPLGPILSFTGGGGKSTLIYLLAGELADAGYAVLVTTTTMIYHPDVWNRNHDRIVISPVESLLELSPVETSGSITVAARREIPHGEKHKLKGFLPEEIDRIAAAGLFDSILVEADGAKHLPVKAPGMHEPVIPSSTRSVFGVIGLDALGTAANTEHVFRIKEFCSLTGKQEGETIDKEVLARLVQSEDGLFKNTPPTAEKIVVFNKADTKEDLLKGIETAEYILKETTVPTRIIITAGQNTDPEGPVRVVRTAEQKEK